MVSSTRRNNKKTEKTQSNKKKVHFNEEEQVNIVEPVPNEKKPELWYTHEDLKMIRKQASCSCSCDTDSDNNGKKERICTCGHHNHSHHQSSQIHHHQQQQQQHEFVVNLLRQQQEQKSMGIESDPKGLFQFSRAGSKLSRQRALQMGRHQAEEVKSFEERRLLTLSVVGDALDLLAGF